MKKNIFIILSLLFLCIFSWSKVKRYSYFWGGETMWAYEVKEKWGSKKFDIEKFRKGSYEDKASMAYSIMTDKSLIGKSYDEIRKMFGPNDGYYRTDTIPTYIIQEGKTHAEDTWQLVFVIGRNDKVRKIIMHKNCCFRE